MRSPWGISEIRNTLNPRVDYGTQPCKSWGNRKKGGPPRATGTGLRTLSRLVVVERRTSQRGPDNKALGRHEYLTNLASKN
jgi:hypothetical protein